MKPEMTSNVTEGHASAVVSFVVRLHKLSIRDWIIKLHLFRGVVGFCGWGVQISGSLATKVPQRGRVPVNSSHSQLVTAIFQ